MSLRRMEDRRYSSMRSYPRHKTEIVSQLHDLATLSPGNSHQYPLLGLKGNLEATDKTKISLAAVRNQTKVSQSFNP
jgi:hypothetical protein